jgi:hypothetical protein
MAEEKKLNYFDIQRADDVVISGWLMKQSPSMFITQFQPRYIVVTGNDKVLRYFKKEEDSTEQGSCYLTDVELIQQQNNEKDCKIFVIKMKEKDRLFVFEASDYPSMMTWVKSIKKMLSGGWSKGQRISVADNNNSSAAAGGSQSPSSSANQDSSSGNVVKAGHLMKESGNIMVLAMQKRFVEISSADNILRYYRNDKELAGSLNLMLLESVAPMEPRQPAHPYKFRLKSVLLDKKSLVMEASSQDEMESWIKAIESCMPDHRRGGGGEARDEAPAVDGDQDMDVPDTEALEEGGGGGRDTSTTNRSTAASDRITSVISAAGSLFARRTSDPSMKKASVISGYLEKQSGNRNVLMQFKMQTRFISVDVDGYLRYYKTETDALDYKNALSAVDLSACEFVRPYDTHDDCKMFELGDGGGGDSDRMTEGDSSKNNNSNISGSNAETAVPGRSRKERVYLFAAPSVEERIRWVEVLAKTIEDLENNNNASSSAKMMMEDIKPAKPAIVELYDSEGKDALLDSVKQKLEDLYPPHWAAEEVAGEAEAAAAVIDGGGDKEEGNPFGGDMGAQHPSSSAPVPSLPSADGAVPLSKHNAGARAIMSYLGTVLRDVKKTKERAARYDIMALVVDAVNRFLDLRLLLATMEGPAGSLEMASTADVYQLITVLTSHQQTLAKIYCPVRDRTRARSTVGGNNQEDDTHTDHDRARSSSGGAGGRDTRTTRHTSDNRGSVGTDVDEAIISQGSAWCTVATNSAGIDVYRFHCEIFDILPTMCKRYIEGNRQHNIAGTADVLIEHCTKVWKELVKNPAEMIRNNDQDGSFYTEMPTLVWRALHSHAHLAQAAGSDLLHVMVAAKIAAALVDMTKRTDMYVENITEIIDGDEELKEVEMEYMCALANDIATNIEEVIALVDGFHIAEVKEKVNDKFDYVTEKLVASGQTCLKRLIQVILNDVKQQFDEIFTEGWLEQGKQMQVAIATIGDYMNDLKEWLMPFWYNKFSVMMAEEVTLRFTHAVLSGPERLDGSATMASNGDGEEEENEPVCGDQMTFGRVSNDINHLNAFFGSIYPDLQQRREEIRPSSGKISDDDRRSSTAGPINDDTADIIVIMELLNELTTYLVADTDQMASAAAKKIAQFPSSAEAIGWFVTACLELRDDVDEDDLEEVSMLLEPGLNSAPNAAFYNDQNGIAEGRLGPVYDALYLLAGEPNYRGADRDSGFEDGEGVAARASASNEHDHDEGGQHRSSGHRGSLSHGSGGNNVTHKLKMMSNIPLAALKKSLMEVNKALMANADDEEEELTEEQQRIKSQEMQQQRVQRARAVSQKRLRRGSNFRRDSLIDAAADLINDAAEEAHEDLEMEAAAMDEIDAYSREKGEMAKQTLKFEGYLDRKAKVMWQSRFFKVDSRVTFDPEDGEEILEHIFMNYNKKGGTLQEGFNLRRMTSLTVRPGPRELVYLLDSRKVMLLAAAANKGITNYVDVAMEKDGVAADHKWYTLEYTVAAEQMPGATEPVDKLHLLPHLCRTANEKKFENVINTLVAGAGLEYDEQADKWTKAEPAE